jgi:hypothetical protein
MGSWQSVVKADSIDWLLESGNPSVRFFTLTELLDRSQNDSEVIAAKKEIMLTGVVPKILAKQENEGNWDAIDRFYTAKYKGTVWQLIMLAELGADETDIRIKKACEFILENSQEHKSGGFSAWLSTSVGGGRYSGILPCLTGNMVWSLIRLGFLDDERVKRGIDWIVQYQRFDDGGFVAPKDWPYAKATGCFGKHSCHMGTAKALKALAEIPTDKRSSEIVNTIKKGAEYFLLHHIFKKSHNLSKVSKPGWLHLGFPLMYQTDVLEILRILTKLGYKDERMQEAIDLLISKQDKTGKWILENTFNGRFQTNIEQKCEPSKWITLYALSVLKRFYG